MYIATYFLSFACAATLEVGIIEFDTHTEAYEEYQRREISGYSVTIHELDVTGSVANEVRKSEGYEDRREV